MSTFAKWLIGCTVGCFLVILLGCGGMAALMYWVTKSVAGRAEKLSVVVDATKARASEIDKLDQAHPPQLPEDVAFAQVSDEDISRYLRIRRELAPQMQALLTTAEAIPLANPEVLGDKPSVREVFGAIKGSVDGAETALAAHLTLLDAAAIVLTREGIGPTDLSRMAEIVEWRYLQRPEAMLLGLPPFRRHEVLELQERERTLSATLAKSEDAAAPSSMGRERMQQQLSEAQARLAEIRTEASAKVGLLEPTRAALDARRAELEALPVAGLAAIAPLSAEGPLATQFGRARGMNHRGHWQWTSGGDSHEEESATPTDAEPGTTPEPSPAPDAPPGTSGASGATGATDP